MSSIWTLTASFEGMTWRDLRELVSRANAVGIPEDLPGLWHYRTIDVATLTAGWIKGRDAATNVVSSDALPTLPWKSDDLAASIGVKPAKDRHTALGDARWALAVWDRVMGR